VRSFIPGVAYRSARVPVAIIDENTNEAFIADLIAEVSVKGGCSKCFQHPASSLVTDYDNVFDSAMTHAWEAAQRFRNNRLIEGRWQVTNAVGRCLKGASISGAALLAWAELLADKAPDDHLIVIAALNDMGELTSVDDDGIEIKVRKIASDCRFDTIIVADPVNKSKAENTLEQAGKSGLIRVIQVSTVAELCGSRSQLAEAVGNYYEGLIEELDKKLPWPRRGTKVKVTEIDIPVRIYKEEIIRESGKGGLTSGTQTQGDDPRYLQLFERESLFKVRREVPWEQELPVIQRAVIVGEPGGGKSFLTYLAAINLAKAELVRLNGRAVSLDQLQLPLHYELNKLTEAATSDIEELFSRDISRYFPTVSSVPEAFRQWYVARLQTAQCLLILDALDQVEGPLMSRVEALLRAFETKGWQTKVIITCRRLNWREDQFRKMVPWLRVMEYEMAPFRLDEMKALIGKWFGAGSYQANKLCGVIDHNFSLRDACEVPLITTLCCLVSEEDELQNQTTRVELYRLVVRKWASGIWQARPPGLPPEEIEESIMRPEDLVFALFPSHPRSNRLEYDVIIQTLAVDRYQASEILKRMLECGILIRAGKGKNGTPQYSFAHRSFYDFFHASAVALRFTESAELRRRIEVKAWLPEWRETITFLAGMLDDPQPLLESLINPKATMAGIPDGDDLFLHRHALAARCLPEISLEKRQSDKLKNLSEDITTTIIDLWWASVIKGTSPAVEQLTVVLSALAAGGGCVGQTVRDDVLRQAVHDVQIRLPLVDLFNHLLGHPEWSVRYAAALALGQMMMSWRIFRDSKETMLARNVDELAGQ
jgi:hypothetical protein